MKRVLPLIWCASILATAACSGGGGSASIPSIAQAATVAGPKVSKATATPISSATPIPSGTFSPSPSATSTPIATPTAIATQTVVAYDPVVNSNASYSNANPVPQGGALGGITTGPVYARDPFHIDWDQFCLAHPANCTGGNPNYAASDAKMVANTLPVSQYGAGITDVCTGAASGVLGQQSCGFAVGTYYATASDPLVTIACSGQCGAGPDGTGYLNGSSIYIPSGALPQQASDGHLSVKQPSGAICQLYFGVANVPPIVSRAVTVQSGACGQANYATEGSSLLSFGGYASNDEMSRGFVRPEDIVGSGGDGSDSSDPYSFYHAMYGSFSNNAPGVVWPAVYGDGQCSASNAINGATPREGMYLYLDSAGFRIVQAWNPPTYLRWLKRALGSVHRHGMIDMDSSGCTSDPNKLYVNTLAWGSQSYVLGGGTSPLDAYLGGVIHPYDSKVAPSGSERAIYANAANASYTFDVLWYKDVPGLSAANFHWLGGGCGQLAVQGASNATC